MKNMTVGELACLSDGRLRARFSRLCKAEAVARKTKNWYKLAEVSEQVSVLMDAAGQYGIQLEPA